MMDIQAVDLVMHFMWKEKLPKMRKICMANDQQAGQPGEQKDQRQGVLGEVCS
jgi:hypothetical protein